MNDEQGRQRPTTVPGGASLMMQLAGSPSILQSIMDKLRGRRTQDIQLPNWTGDVDPRIAEELMRRQQPPAAPVAPAGEPWPLDELMQRAQRIPRE